MTREQLIVTATCAMLTICCAGPPEAGPPDRSQPDAAPAADRAGCRPEQQALAPSGEGMWPWSQLTDLDARALAERGLEVPLEQLWKPGTGGLFRAAVGLRGCSASFVSPDGLMISNHHCVFRAIRRNSTPERNLLADGFVAGTRGEELDGHGLRAYVFREQTDVTQRVLGDLPTDLDDLDRMQQIELREKAVIKECEAEPNTRCRISRNNDGLSFVLLRNTELKDIRLVAAPPRSLGEFGGEVDNWQWPRHTMDFALVRAYVDPQGQPAEYDPANVPYKPEHHFQVGANGIDQGDLVMVVGTPYRTARYRTLAAVKADLEWYYPLRQDLFSSWLEVLDETCVELPDACLPTASRNKSLNNALTNARGMITGLQRAQILERKAALEQRWRNWVTAEPERGKRFGNALDDLTRYLTDHEAGRDRDFLIRYLLWGNHLLGFARTITKWAAEQEKPDAEREPGFQDRDRENTLDDLKQAQRSLHLEADRRVLAFFLARFGTLPASERLASLDRALNGDYGKAAIDAFVTRLYRGSRLGEQEQRAALFGRDLAALRGDRDAAIGLALDLKDELDAYDQRKKRRDGALSRLRPPFIESLVALLGKQFYPDANASPRVSFATVTGYRPRDGVWHTPRTTLDGLAAKATGVAPFDAPPAALEAIRARRFGRFADERLKDVPVCFLSNADTTGGNSGSPALDGRGQLVGLNFDRVYENIAGDYGYNPHLSRNIMVEIRSVLWYLDEVLGADAILRELQLPPAD